MAEPFEMAARAVCATEAADMNSEQRRAYVEANWRQRHSLLVAAHATIINRQKGQHP